MPAMNVGFIRGILLRLVLQSNNLAKSETVDLGSHGSGPGYDLVPRFRMVSLGSQSCFANSAESSTSSVRASLPFRCVYQHGSHAHHRIGRFANNAVYVSV